MPEGMMEKAKKWIAQVTELGLLLIALAIVLDVLVVGELFEEQVGASDGLVGPAGLAGGLAESSAGRIARELASMAEWLGLERVDVVARGDLSEPLRTAGRFATPT